jgi:predicted DNA-binding transcriptional regulator YafY
LRKLVRALPESFRAGAEAAASAVVIDPASWDRTTTPPPMYLDELQKAAIDGVQVRISYAGRDRPESVRTVHPLGLVVKGAVWYLIANTEDGLRTFRVGRVRSAERTTEAVVRPDGFDLAAYWKSAVETLDERRAPVKVKIRMDRNALPWLRTTVGNRMRVLVDAERAEVEVRGHGIESVAAELAGFGARVEVIQPDEVRAELARLATELLRAHGERPSNRAVDRPASG